MRNALFAATAIAVLVLTPISSPVTAKPGGWSGKGSGGMTKSAGSFKSIGSHGKSFGGKGHRFAKPGSGGFRHARRFHRPGPFFFGWPLIATTTSSLIVRAERNDEEKPLPPPPRIVEWKIYAVGTEGGCRSESVNVPEGTVTVLRC